MAVCEVCGNDYDKAFSEPSRTRKVAGESEATPSIPIDSRRLSSLRA